MKLSIIIPIYNAYPYLRTAIDSVLSQGMNSDEFELLLINDGSTDDSLLICESYVKTSFSVKIFTHKNQGVVRTRNFGLSKAEGDYVYFMDADDYLIPGGFRYLIDTFWDEHVDVLSFNSLTVDRYSINCINDDVRGIVSYEGTGREFYQESFFAFVWSHFYRREFLMKHKLEFDDLVMAEDTLFNLKVHLANPKIKNVTSRLYRYCVHDGTITKKRDYLFMRKCVNSYLYLFNTLAKHIEICKVDEEKLAYGLRKMTLKQFTPFISRILSSDYSVRELIKIKQVLSDIAVLPIGKEEKVMLNIFRYPLLFPIFKCIYRNIFIPFILPRLSRN